MVAGKAADPVTAPEGTAASHVTRSLADVLASGPLPLAVALAYASEIASRAAAVHREGGALGSLSPARIAIGPNGPVMPAPNGVSQPATQASDLRDFGLLLYQMVTGLDPSGYSPPANTNDELEPSPQTVRSGALRLVERCCRAAADSDMRHVSAELRLLQVMVNSFDPNELVEVAAEQRQAESAATAVTPAIAAEPIKPAVPAEPAAPPKPVPQAKPTAETKPAPPAKLTAPKNRNWGCPSCGSAEYFLCQHLTILEKLLSLAGMKTYRCYRCFQRFISVFGEQVPRPENG